MAECVLAGRIGPKGDTGPQGARGPQGPTGPAGTSGKATYKKFSKITVSTATTFFNFGYGYSSMIISPYMSIGNWVWEDITLISLASTYSVNMSANGTRSVLVKSNCFEYRNTNSSIEPLNAQAEILLF